LERVLNKGQDSYYVDISENHLRDFFEKSLKTGNNKGLSLLINYLERNEVDISDWEIQRFRQSLDQNLNQSFDKDFLQTFLRYYTHFALSQLSQPEVKEISNSTGEADLQKTQ
jgi:Glu-tRNA(Gln) amidotransferase subunit E-like FAD-binding protein